MYLACKLPVSWKLWISIYLHYIIKKNLNSNLYTNIVFSADHNNMVEHSIVDYMKSIYNKKPKRNAVQLKKIKMKNKKINVNNTPKNDKKKN